MATKIDVSLDNQKRMVRDAMYTLSSEIFVACLHVGLDPVEVDLETYTPHLPPEDINNHYCMRIVSSGAAYIAAKAKLAELEALG